jgi:O-antigen/teichoic acid export membrane protein
MLMLAISLVGTGWLLFMKMRLIPWLPFGVRYARWQCVRELWKPAISFMAFPTCGIVSVQGMTMMVGYALGPLAVAVFNPMRTLSRPAYLLTEAIKNSVWQELSVAYGQKNWDLARKLHRTAVQASLWIALIASIALAISGARVFALWTHGKVVMDTSTFYLLLGVVFANSVWNASSAVPLAGNKHQRLAIVYLALTSVSLLMGYPLMVHFGLKGAGIALLFSEIGMGVFVLRISNKLLLDRRSAFAMSMIDTTQFMILLAWLKRRLV